jgi:predicted metalloprotease with PDZ domain
LWTPNFNVPMQDDLLWVYEGLTQYYGYVLTARAGMRTPLETRDLMAGIAANYEASPGRDWRPLVDTTNQPTMSQRVPVSWVSWQRGEDYYQESLLIWLSVDTRIREMSQGAKSLDDFAKLFYSMDNGSFVTRTYTFDDIVAALNQVQPYDWAGFLRARVYELHPQVPEEGFTQGGYKLVYNDTESEWMKHGAPGRGGANYGTSIGFSFDKDNKLTNVWWNSPAFKAGMAPDMTLVSVNGEAFNDARLRAALLDAEHGQAPLSFVVKRGDQVSTVAVAYHGGLRIPHLERVAGTPDRLDAILAARK